MTEVIVNTDNQSKRRLPIWMQSNDTSKNEKLGTFVGLCSTSGNQTETQDDATMIESMPVGNDEIQAEEKKNSEKKEFFAKNCSKKNTRKLKKCDGSKNFMCNRSGTKIKSEGKIVERAKSIDAKRMKLKCAKNNPSKVLSQGMTEDTAELSVEDLISIAEEFLTSDKEMQNKKSESDSFPMNSSESSIPRGNLNREVRFSQPLSKCSKFHDSHINNIEESATSSANKLIQSGDAAQDMLELFLGPLLKKVPLKKPNIEPTRELITSIYESDSLHREKMDKLDIEKHETLMKKKSSFKDKVAFIYD